MFTKKTLKKVTAVSAALVLAFGAAACNRDSGDSGSGGGDNSVTLALSTRTNPFFVQLQEGAQKKADELGIKLNIQDASDDAAKQNDQLNNAATTGSKVVIVNPTDSDAVVAAVQALNNANIPVVAVDRSASGGTVDSFIASDNVAGGKQAADALAQSIGDEGEVLVLQGIAGSSASRDRGKGFTDGIAHTPTSVLLDSRPLTSTGPKA